MASNYRWLLGITKNCFWLQHLGKYSKSWWAPADFKKCTNLTNRFNWSLRYRYHVSTMEAINLKSISTRYKSTTKETLKKREILADQMSMFAIWKLMTDSVGNLVNFRGNHSLLQKFDSCFAFALVSNFFFTTLTTLFFALLIHPIDLKLLSSGFSVSRKWPYDENGP